MPDKHIPDDSLLRDSHVTKKLKPGDAGTLHLQERFGRKLVAVRYRRSADGRNRFVTVELLISAHSISPSFGPDTIVTFKTRTDESMLHAKLLANGAQWNSRARAHGPRPSTSSRNLALQSGSFRNE